MSFGGYRQLRNQEPQCKESQSFLGLFAKGSKAKDDLEIQVGVARPRSHIRHRGSSLGPRGDAIDFARFGTYIPSTAHHKIRGFMLNQGERSSGSKQVTLRRERAMSVDGHWEWVRGKARECRKQGCITSADLDGFYPKGVDLRKLRRADYDNQLVAIGGKVSNAHPPSGHWANFRQSTRYVSSGEKMETVGSQDGAAKQRENESQITINGDGKFLQVRGGCSDQMKKQRLLRVVENPGYCGFCSCGREHEVKYPVPPVTYVQKKTVCTNFCERPRQLILQMGVQGGSGARNYGGMNEGFYSYQAQIKEDETTKPKTLQVRSGRKKAALVEIESDQWESSGRQSSYAGETSDWIRRFGGHQLMTDDFYANNEQEFIPYTYSSLHQMRVETYPTYMRKSAPYTHSNSTGNPYQTDYPGRNQE